MANTYISLYIHYIFSTKNRTPQIVPEIRDRLWPYLGGIVRDKKMKAIKVGGTRDHVHMLVSLPSTISIAEAVQLIKGNSSRWVNDTYRPKNKFEWQEGYGAFSVSVSTVEKTIRYIENQEEHHRRKTFKEEYVEFLKKNGIEYDERYIWN